MPKLPTNSDSPLMGDSRPPSCSAWRDPETDPPTKTGKILIWIEGIGPSIVNAEERWMCYWNGNDETEPTAPHEWDWWMEISPPNVSDQATASKRLP